MVFERKEVKQLAEIEKKIVGLELAREELRRKLAEIRGNASRLKVEIFNSIKAGKEKKVRELFRKLWILDVEERRILTQIRNTEKDIVEEDLNFKNLYDSLRGVPLTDVDYAYILKKAGYKNPGSPETVNQLMNKLQIREKFRKQPSPIYNELVKDYEEAIKKAQREGNEKAVSELKQDLEKIVNAMRQETEEEKKQIAQMRQDIANTLEMAPEAKGKYSRAEKWREKFYRAELTAEAIGEAVGRGLLKSGIAKASKPVVVAIIGLLIVFAVFGLAYTYYYLPRQTVIQQQISAFYAELMERGLHEQCRFTALLQAQNPNVVCRPPELVEPFEQILSYAVSGPELVVVKQTIPYAIDYVMSKPKSLFPKSEPITNLQLKKVEVRSDRGRCITRWPNPEFCPENPIVEIVNKTESCVAASCELNEDEDKAEVSVWVVWANDDIVKCKFCEGRSRTRSFLAFFESEYEYTAPGTATSIMFSTSEILPPIAAISKVNVGPVSVDIEASKVHIFKKDVPTTPAVINIKLKNNGDGEAKVKQVVIEQIKDPEAELIVFGQCTEENVETTGSKTTFVFDEGEIILKPKGGYTLIQCQVDFSNIKNSAKLNAAGYLSYTLKPYVSYSYTVRRQVNTVIDPRCDLVKISDPEREEEICKQFE